MDAGAISHPVSLRSLNPVITLTPKLPPRHKTVGITRVSDKFYTGQ